MCFETARCLYTSRLRCIHLRRACTVWRLDKGVRRGRDVTCRKLHNGWHSILHTGNMIIHNTNTAFTPTPTLTYSIQQHARRVRTRTHQHTNSTLPFALYAPRQYMCRDFQFQMQLALSACAYTPHNTPHNTPPKLSLVSIACTMKHENTRARSAVLRVEQRSGSAVLPEAVGCVG